MGDDREKAPLCKGAFGAMQPGKTILDKSRASPVDCSCNQCKHWLQQLFIFSVEEKINAIRIPSGVPEQPLSMDNGCFYFSDRSNQKTTGKIRFSSLQNRKSRI